MSSSYTTSLKIQEIGNGEQSGIWGSTTNTNWQLIEQAVAGVQTITMSNNNYTLSNLNGLSDEARNMVLVVTGTNNTTYQVIAPLVPKMYVVTNNTSGGNAITIGASSGSVVTIPNGVTAQVYCDGSTGFFSAQTGSAGNFVVNGTLTATGLADTGNLSVGGTLAVTGNETVGGNLTVTGSITAGSITGLTGRIVQTQSASFTAGSTTNNTSPTATGFTLSITPTSTSSKILVLYSGPFYNPSGAGGFPSGNAYLTMYRNSTNLAGGTNYMADLLSDNSNLYASCAINYLDSPSTTSAITYQPYIWCDSGTGVGILGFCYMTLLEIL